MRKKAERSGLVGDKKAEYAAAEAIRKKNRLAQMSPGSKARIQARDRERKSAARTRIGKLDPAL